ncbi:MAG: DUF4230 domain-containing protein [Caldilineales bacterium]|nr:DUF4230 domain-containing protein [Caldilineales bacterium]
MNKLQDSDLNVQGDSVVIKLPPPEVFFVVVDNENTRVYSRETGLFRRPDPQLESEARRLAEERLRNWALENAILQKAAGNAAPILRNLLVGLGFTDITIEFKPLQLETNP